MSQWSSLDSQETKIKTRHSFYNTGSPNASVPSKSETSRSEVNVLRTKDFPSIIDSGCVNRKGLLADEKHSEEYYKKYEHDEIPVKDDSSLSVEINNDNGPDNDRKELTNSDLDKLEIRIYKNISKELQTDQSSTDSLEYNIKLFKTTVQEIFDNFKTNMRDFEGYKKKFQEILDKSQENTVDEMENFIKEMIQYIISSESCTSNASNETNLLTFSEIATEANNEMDSTIFSLGTDQLSTPKSTVEAFKNENYLTDSTIDDESSKVNRSENNEKIYNIYLLSGNPCVEIKMDGRNLLSEINIRNPCVEGADEIASADNIKSVAAKKLQVEKYMKHQVVCQSNDKIIPVKISYAKKDIHSEEVSENVDDNNKSFIFKICNYLCRKIRKNAFS
ncbi:uncharacterized protein [Epargyreus clarus]|uniref:uncharacterized protein n=1 Tax=Epargyreus clarus TaxID=520877 RepID=UPI003C3028AB